MKLYIQMLLGLFLISVTSFAQKISLTKDNLSYYQNQGTASINFETLVDEQALITVVPQNNVATPTPSGIYNPSWGTIPKVLIELGGTYNLSNFALFDGWNASTVSVKYDNNGTWTNLFTWDMSYSNKWKVVLTTASTSKLLIEYSALGTQIGEIAVFGTPVTTNGCNSSKLAINSSMIFNEGTGNAASLVDEQTVAGNPKTSTGGAPVSLWNSGTHAYVDLGSVSNITDIYLRDLTESGAFIISSGAPGNWAPIITDNLTGQQSWNSHPVDLHTRYLRFTRATSTSNVAEVVIYGCLGTPPPDKMAPNAIQNLSVASKTNASVTLNWTAPGDDGTIGTAKSYDIRYAPFPIAAATFANATQVSGAPVPSTSGTLQSFTVSGLTAGSQYYFAISTRDEVPNTSQISNVIVTVTPGGTSTCTSAKLLLDETMVTDEEKYGTAQNLVNEQALAGDPVDMATGGPTQDWNPGWGKIPSNAYIDLKTPKKISAIFIKDVSSSGNLRVSVGYPGNWVELYTQDLNQSDHWRKKDVDITTRYIRFTRLGNGSNVGEVVLYGCMPPNADITAPATISNLSAGTITAKSAAINFTAPGDDGSTGTASAYDVRYSYDPITEANFAAAKTPKALYKPLSAGSAQTIVVENLISSKSYYIAIKTYDEFGNSSGIASIRVTTPTLVQPQMFTMDKFIGTNAFIDDPLDKMQAVGFIREYHNWGWDEADVWKDKDGNIHGDISYKGYPDTKLKFSPSYGSGGLWDFDAYYLKGKNGGLEISPDLKQGTPWLQGGPLNFKLERKPVDALGDPTTDPRSYEKRAHYLYQYAARYGSTKVAENKLTLATDQQKLSGLDYIKYIEDWNEPNKWWEGADSKFSPEEYAAMISADYDGHQKALAGGYGTFGVKNADPNIKLVMGGLAEIDLNFLEKMRDWFIENRSGNNVIALDALNVHHYAFKNGVDETGGGPPKSPEEDQFKERMLEVVNFRNTYMPGKEVWISEFGWDTEYPSALAAPTIGANDPQEVQGQWLVRGYLAFAAAGVDRAQQFMLRDPFTDPGMFWQKFSTSGMTKGKGSWEPKKSWYYVYTLKNTLKNTKFLDEQPSGNSNILVYRFKNVTTNEIIHAVWAKTSSDLKVPGHSLTLAGAPTTGTARLIEMQPGDQDGIASNLNILNGKVTVDVSERPIFIKVAN
jgi:hypothetical protein